MLDPRPYVAEWPAHGLDRQDLQALDAALVLASGRLSIDGHPVVFLHSAYLPDVRRWAAVFLADGPEVVLRVAHVAQLPSVEVHRAHELVALGGGPVDLARPRTVDERNSP